VPRSGTTLAAAIMNAHRRMSCGNETHFFERLTDAVAVYLTDHRYWPDRALSYMHSLLHMGRPIFDLYHVEPDDYAARLRRSRRTASGILSSFMESHLARIGKDRWVEKTPGHLKRFTTIRACFPNSLVVCIFRDPRDVALSLLNVPWGTSTFLDGLLFWYSFYNYYETHIRECDGVLTVRFEDLVLNPVATAQRICSFVGERYDDGMLQTSESAVDVGSSFEPYKKNASKPLDGTRAFGWKQTLKGEQVDLCDRLLYNCLISLNYPVSTASHRAVESVSPFAQYQDLLQFLESGRDATASKIQHQPCHDSP